jgi:hypothetical protein
MSTARDAAALFDAHLSSLRSAKDLTEAADVACDVCGKYLLTLLSAVQVRDLPPHDWQLVINCMHMRATFMHLRHTVVAALVMKRAGRRIHVL